MKNIKVVYMGTPLFSVNPLKGLIENYDVIAVVTQPDKEKGRGKNVSKSEVKKLCEEHGIRVIQPVKIREEYQEILDLKPDIIVTCAYGQIIPLEILNAPVYGCINVHASLLPKYRGGAPIHRAIMNGDSKTGITIMYMDKGMDSGDIIKQSIVDIDFDMNTTSLEEVLSKEGERLLLDTLPSIIDRTCERIKQNESDVTFAKIIKKEDEQLDFDDTTVNVYNKIRGLSYVPGAYTMFDSKIFKIYKARISSYVGRESAGTITNIYKDGIGVKTKDGEIVLLEVKPEGKKMMDAKSFINGFGKDNLIGKKFEKDSYEIR